jgi:serine/threonine-protein kinase RsbW
MIARDPVFQSPLLATPPQGWSSAMKNADPPHLRFALRFDATLVDIRTALGKVTDDLRAHAAAPALVDDVNIVLCEVLTNIARHGYPYQTGWIACALVLSVRGVECQVTDAGLPYDPSVLGLAMPVAQARAEGGYGWALIRALCEGLQYERCDGQNELRFLIPAGPSEPARRKA